MEKADDLEAVNANMVPPLLDAVLVDYHRNVPDARDAEVLDVMTTIISKLNVRWTIHTSKYSVRTVLRDSSNTTLTYSRVSCPTKYRLSWKTSLSVLWR